MDKPVEKKLTLNRETLRELTTSELKLAAGGAGSSGCTGMITVVTRGCTLVTR
jgi:hypothetical protein